ncbi:MAG TPA: NAD(P)-dependent oxidoreductase [Patescibacteria group bacterium]|nr:NAD(P)-dependent oxidoreductase [Patescibacteria group bacterium]
MKIVLTGATGLVGSRFFDLLKSKYEIIPLSSSYGIDITDAKKTNKFLSDKNPDIIVHLAAKTNVDACEDDRENDLKKLKKAKLLEGKDIDFENLNKEAWKNSSSAFGINVVGTKNLSDWVAENDRKIIYVSTDFIFDGQKESPYSEEDIPTPVDWYGQTKLWGEKTLGEHDLVVRIAYPFGYKSPLKRDLIWTLVELLRTKEIVELVSDQTITPTFIDDIAYGLDFLINKDTSGIINLVGNNFISPRDIGVALAREYNIPETKIELTTRGKLYKGRAARPFNVSMKNDKLVSLGFQMTDFFEALKKIKQ